MLAASGVYEPGGCFLTAMSIMAINEPFVPLAPLERAVGWGGQGTVPVPLLTGLGTAQNPLAY